MECTDFNNKEHLEFLEKIHQYNLETDQLNKATSEKLIDELEWDEEDIEDVKTEPKNYEITDPDLLPDI